MEISGQLVLFFIVVLGVSIYVIASIRSIFQSLVKIFKELARRRKIRKIDFSLIDAYLDKIQYYHYLSQPAKEKFVRRLKIFLSDKLFVGMNDLEVTPEMRIHISAAAIQLTFGLSDYSLPLFYLIKIYPDEFYSRMLDGNLKGGTTQSGIIMLSWKDFLKGNEIPDDKINLGFHEMGHALLVDMLYGGERNTHLEAKIGQWENAGEPEMERMRAGKSLYLRAYGGTNEQEFFAVSVEHFFEAPHEFEKNLPDIYLRLCRLLNQDPRNKSRDYEFSEEAVFNGSA